MAHEAFPSYPSIADAIEDAERITIRWSHDNVRNLSSGQVAAIVAALRAQPSETATICVPEKRLRDLLDSAERGLKNLVAAEIRGILLGSPASEPPSAMEKQ